MWYLAIAGEYQEIYMGTSVNKDFTMLNFLVKLAMTTTSSTC